MRDIFSYYLIRCVTPIVKTPVIFFTGFISINIAIMSDVQKAFLFLIGCILFDFCTGVYASHVSYVDSMKVEGFTRKLSAFFFEVLESKKIRKTAIKSLTYFMLALSTFFLENSFFKKETLLESDPSELEITVWVLIFCSLIELYSAVFENLKKAGFDLRRKIEKTVSGLKSLIKVIKDFFNTLK